MPTLPWSQHNQIELSTSNFFQGIAVVEFFDPARGRFLTQSLLSVMEAPTEARPTVNPIEFRMQGPSEESFGDPVYHLRVMLDRLNGMKNFGENWDSYGSQPPSDHAIKGACNLVWNVIARCYAVSGEKAIPYSIVPLPGSGVQIEWRGRTDSIEVEIGHDSKFNYLLTRNEARPERYREEHDDVSEGEILRLVASTIS